MILDVFDIILDNLEINWARDLVEVVRDFTGVDGYPELGGFFHFEQVTHNLEKTRLVKINYNYIQWGSE